MGIYSSSENTNIRFREAPILREWIEALIFVAMLKDIHQDNAPTKLSNPSHDELPIQGY